MNQHPSGLFFTSVVPLQSIGYLLRGLSWRWHAGHQAQGHTLGAQLVDPAPAPAVRQVMAGICELQVPGGRVQDGKQASDEHFAKPWSLLAGGKVIFTMPRAAVLRSMVMNHLIHHRAQLGVYLRLTGVAVPAIYGPSADEAGFR